VRRALLTAAVAIAALLAPATAHAEEEQFADALADLEQARVLVDRSIELTEEGDREQAYEVARTAYLEHFEFVEIPLRLRNPNLVLDLEFKFADLRDGIADGESVSQLKDTRLEIVHGLDDVERELTDPGLAAPAAAFGFSFAILFREGLEAVLIIAIVLGSLEAAKAANYRRPLTWGVGAAIAATAALFALTATVVELAPVDRELLEAGAALLAVGVLFMVSFWLVARLEQRRWMEFMRSRVSAAVAAGGAAAFVGLGFTAVFREGFETVLFYQALTLFAEGMLGWVAAGAAAAAVALAGIAYAIFGLGKKLPIKPMLITAVSLLLLMSVAFVGNAVRSLQSIDVIHATPIEGEWARLPIFLAELTGIHPTVEGIATQAALLGVYVLGAAWVFGVRPLREKRAAKQLSEGAA
jgi:high-affinity iron transporter